VRAIKVPAGGFTIIEAAVTLAVMAVLMAVGIPSMSSWLQARKAAAAGAFYKEGFQLARAQAVGHNGAARLVLSENAASGQMDWRVDICFPTPSVPCNQGSGGWSTTGAPASGDPDQAHGFRSVARSADALPSTSAMLLTLSPDGASEVYFTPLGWVDAGISPRLSRIDLQPAPDRTGAFGRMAVVLTLAGTASICDPGVAAHDSRGCPPTTSP
jgi:type IV fimbrial biogenesis protein FimT